MIRPLGILALLAVFSAMPGIAEPQGQTQAAPASLEERREAILAETDRTVGQLTGSETFSAFVERYQAHVDRNYAKQETLFDSQAAQDYIKSRMADPAQAPVQTAAEGLTDASVGDDPADADAELALAGGEVQSRPRQAAAVDLSGQAFLEQVTDFDEVKTFVVGELYRLSQKLGLQKDGVKLYGVHPVLLLAGLNKVDGASRPQVIKDIVDLARRPGTSEALGPIINAMGSKEQEEPKRAVALLDAYIEFRKASDSSEERLAAVSAAIDSCGLLVDSYLKGSRTCADAGDVPCREVMARLWSYQKKVLEEVSRNGTEESIAINVYAYLADAVLMLDLREEARRKAEDESQGRSATTSTAAGDGPLSPGGLTAAQYSSGMDSLEAYIDDVKNHQKKIEELLMAYERTINPEEKERVRTQILQLYAGVPNRVRPIELKLLDIEENSNVRLLAAGPPEGADPVLRNRHERVFARGHGTVFLLFRKQAVLRQMMQRAGLGIAVDQSRERVGQERERIRQEQTEGGPRAAGGDNRAQGRDRGRSGGGMGGFFDNLGRQAGPLTDQIFQANQQARIAEAQERSKANEELRQSFEQDRQAQLDRDAQLNAEQSAAGSDRLQNQVEGAQTLLDQQAERERLEEAAFAERRRKAEEERRVQEEQRRQEQQRQQALERARNTGTTATGNGPGAPTSTGSPAGSGGSGGPVSTAAGPQAGPEATGTARGDTPQGNDVIFTDAQINEIAGQRVPVSPNSFGIEPAVLTDAEIRAAIDPVIAQKVTQLNSELAEKRITVNADLQYSGPNIRSTGLPPNHDRHQMWLSRFPDMRTAAVEAAQLRYNMLFREQVQILSASRQQQIANQQAAAQRNNQPAPQQSPVAVAQTRSGPQAPQAATQEPQRNTPETRREPVAEESPEVKKAREVIAEFEEKAGAKSGISPQTFLDALSRYNATSPVDLDISFKTLVKLVKQGAISSAVKPPEIDESLGPDGVRAQSVIEEFERQAGGKSGITPEQFLTARRRLNATNPFKVEINLPGLIRLINIGALRSQVAVPTRIETNPSSATPSTGGGLSDDGRFEPGSSGF